ncbi:hypothetical protein [Amycolatopsis sp. FU40]|nr:hypothetical protein [Amycolatopsis sp. FU40]
MAAKPGSSTFDDALTPAWPTVDQPAAALTHHHDEGPDTTPSG